MHFYLQNCHLDLQRNIVENGVPLIKGFLYYGVKAQGRIVSTTQGWGIPLDIAMFPHIFFTHTQVERAKNINMNQGDIGV